MELGGCTWIINTLHGRLHHPRMRALMLTPFARSLLFQIALLLCVLVNSNPSLTMPCIRHHGPSRES
jgi:hypothetical protein